MAKNVFLKSELSRWFASQSRFRNKREMATAIDIPYETLRGYFKGTSPCPENIPRLSHFTGLNAAVFEKPTAAKEKSKGRTEVSQITYASRIIDNLQSDLARCLRALVPARKVLLQQIENSETKQTCSAQSVQLLMDALQRSLEPFVEDSKALFVLRKEISGSDTAYLSGLLGAIFDDKRLQRWRDMTTYKYGSK